MNPLLLQAINNGKIAEDQLSALVEEFIAERGTDDPKVQLVLQLLARRQLEQEEAELELEEEELPLPEPPPTQQKSAGGREIVEKVKEKLITLHQENQVLREENEAFRQIADMFTRAIGACICLGENPDCPQCQGTGKPGTFEIDQELFAYFFLPAQKQYKPAPADNRRRVNR